MTLDVRLAHAIGAHAVLAWILALALLMLAIAGVVAAARRRGRSSMPTGLPDRTPATGPALRRALSGLAFVAAAGLTLHAMSQALQPASAIGRFDQALADTLRAEVAPSTLQAVAVVTHLGDPQMLWLIAGTLVLLHASQRAWVPAAVSALAMAGNGASGRLLKHVFERTRPLHDEALWGGASGWSFPSGHSSGAVVAYGLLAWVALRHLPPRGHLPVLLTAVAIAFSVGASRIVLQAHFASDVVGGWALGSAWLAAAWTSLGWHDATGGGRLQHRPSRFG